MSEHCGYIVKVEHLRPHSNADRLQIATFFLTNDVIVDMNVHVGDIGVYFPVDLQLSERFCAVNDLVRRRDENGKQCGGYLGPGKRNIKAIKLRGEKSDGLYLPITCLADFCAISELNVGDRIEVLNGEEICCKYIPRRNASARYHGAHAPKKAKVNIAPTFYEHVDTEQLAYNLDRFKEGDIVQLTLKMHGTSGRTGYLPLLQTKRSIWDRIFHPHKETYEYGYITGTRRVVLDGTRQGGFYESDDFREAMAKKFEGKLRKGETVYYEIIGFQGPNGAPIMAEVQNSKVKDPEFTKRYGKTTVFSYGCVAEGAYTDEQPCCEIYVYRMTMVNADGDVVEYSPAQIRERCEQMGVHTVMEFETFIIPSYEIDWHTDGNGNPYADAEDYHIVDPGEYVLRKVEKYFDGADPIGKTHVREGVVARILNRSKFEVYKHKNWLFKVLEGIAKDEATAPDLEEAQEVVDDSNT